MYALVFLLKHIWKIKGLRCSKGRKIWWNRKRSFFKNHRNCLLRTSTKGCLFRTFNSYSFSFKGGLYNRRTGYYPCPGGEQFLWFLKNDLLRLQLILLIFWLEQTFVFEMCLVGSTKANSWILMLWILVSVALKKWCFSWRLVYLRRLNQSYIFHYNGQVCTQFTQVHSHTHTHTCLFQLP